MFWLRVWCLRLKHIFGFNSRLCQKNCRMEWYVAFVENAIEHRIIPSQYTINWKATFGVIENYWIGNVSDYFFFASTKERDKRMNIFNTNEMRLVGALNVLIFNTFKIVYFSIHRKIKSKLSCDRITINTIKLSSIHFIPFFVNDRSSSSSSSPHSIFNEMGISIRSEWVFKKFSFWAG